jgi:heme a synthase
MHRRRPNGRRRPPQPAVAGLLVAGLYLQIILGGFVAGTRAGLTYNSWPLMDGALVPAGLGILEPWYRNLTENITTVQFDHRVLAYVVALLAIGHALAILHAWQRGRTTAVLVALGIVAQAGLGIATLLSVTDGRIPILLGVAHQVGAALVFALAILHLSRMITPHVSTAPA